jgi:hypothetical protein
MLPLTIRIDGFHLGRGQNDREHWAAKARRVKRERTRLTTELWLRFRGLMFGDPSEFRARCGAGPWLVTLTRLAPSAGLDDDNLAGSFKAVRDELAAWLGVDDGNQHRVRWLYAQRHAPWGIELRIEDRDGPTGATACQFLPRLEHNQAVLHAGSP